MSRITAIYLRPSSRTPVRSVECATAIPGKGLEGDHAGSRTRQITLLDLDAWLAACDTIDRTLEPSVRRANVVVQGLDLARSRGRRVQLGQALVEIVGETVPCRLMEESAVGLQDALRPAWRGGVYGRVEVGGAIAVGDAVAFV